MSDRKEIIDIDPERKHYALWVEMGDWCRDRGFNTSRGLTQTVLIQIGRMEQELEALREKAKYLDRLERPHERPHPLDQKIKEALPFGGFYEATDHDHERYVEALKFVSTKHDKYSFVDFANWAFRTIELATKRIEELESKQSHV